MPEAKYGELKKGNYAIVTFDVPERERRKREWLRCVLKNLKFRPVQQSVWLGRTKIPIDFLDDLKDLNMTDYVEIFEVSRQGTLRHVV
ncbi:MAG: hypothetical protein HZA25_01965 [Candidatus Niyogibacteria bacterium]|nr:hypothetical protein [Candidatus Niyogibacteria bacterium]